MIILECFFLAQLAFCSEIPLEDSVISELISVRNLPYELVEKAYNYLISQQKG